MNNLYLLQFACFLFMLFNALILLITRMQAKWISPRYERSRRFVLAGIIGMAAQFFAQMCYGFRATNDACHGSHHQHPYLYSMLFSYSFGHLPY